MHPRISPIHKEDGTWAHSEQDKYEVYVRYFESVCQPYYIVSELKIISIT